MDDLTKPVHAGHRNVGRRFICASALAAIVVAPLESRGQQSPSTDSLKTVMRTATIAFYGQLLRPGSNVPNVDTQPSTWIVRVIEPIQMPRSMQRLTTTDLTIALRPGGTEPIGGARAVFYAHGWVMGGGYAIVEDARFETGADVSAALILWRVRTDSAVRSLDDDRLREELSRAATVIAARIDTIVERPLVSSGRFRREHHPMWRDARLRVLSVLKASGTPLGEAAAAIIPGSEDIVWEGIPRVRAGDSYVFVLFDPHAFPQPLAGVLSSDRYAVTRSSHIRPLADTVRVRRLMLSTTPPGMPPNPR